MKRCEQYEICFKTEPELSLFLSIVQLHMNILGSAYNSTPPPVKKSKESSKDKNLHVTDNVVLH